MSVEARPIGSGTEPELERCRFPAARAVGIESLGIGFLDGVAFLNDAGEIFTGNSDVQFILAQVRVHAIADAARAHYYASPHRCRQRHAFRAAEEQSLCRGAA